MLNFLSLLCMIMLPGCYAGCQPRLISDVDTSDRVEIEDCNNDVDDYACNIVGKNSDGLYHDLYMHQGKPIVVDISAMWCGYCQRAGMESQEVQDKYDDIDLVFMTVLTQNFSGESPSLTDLKNWEDNFSISSAPVVSTSTDVLSSDPKTGYSVQGFPTFVFIDKNLKIVYIQRGYNMEYSEYVIDTMLR